MTKVAFTEVSPEFAYSFSKIVKDLSWTFRFQKTITEALYSTVLYTTFPTPLLSH
jgi:hypothetical protein